LAQQGSVEKRSNDIEEPALLPTKAELQKLLGMLLFEGEEMDEVSASIILDRAGLIDDQFLERLGSRLENRAAEMRVEGKEVSQALLDTIRSLEPNTWEADPDRFSAEGAIDALRYRQVAEEIPADGKPGYVQARQMSEKDYLTEDDLRILEEVAKELRAAEEKG
jgi:predicted metal-dependent phosphoesterase TrpH